MQASAPIKQSWGSVIGQILIKETGELGEIAKCYRFLYPSSSRNWFGSVQALESEMLLNGLGTSRGQDLYSALISCSDNNGQSKQLSLMLTVMDYNYQ